MIHAGVRVRVRGAGSTVLAFLVAPLATLPAIAGVLGLAYVLGLGTFGDASLLLFLNSLAAFALFGMPLAYLTALVLGIPACAMARRFRLLGFGHSLGCRRLGGAPAALALLRLGRGHRWIRNRA